MDPPKVLLEDLRHMMTIPPHPIGLELNRPKIDLSRHCYIKCLFLGLGASFGQFSSNGISFHHELMFAMGLEF